MEGRRPLVIKLVILFVGSFSAEQCDRATTAQVQAGNIGQSGDFNWLGILHVHLHDVGKVRIAMTGIVLIKIKYALANADDLVRIPQQVFDADSKIMFLAARDSPWFTKPKSYVTHPEYEYSTLNTIAVIELNLDNIDDFPLNPICMPTGETFNTSKHLYLTGFTDENQKMEKTIYNIQYLEKNVCEEFYNRAGLSSQKRVPTEYLCGYATSNVTQCVWDNGMALVSNVTGYFQLVGFGIHGPGCAAPARFIDLFPYFSWINSVTSPDDFYDADYRRKSDDEFIPVHDLFTKNGSRRAGKTVYKHEVEWYPFDADALKHYLIRPSHDRAILIFPFNDTWEQYQNACRLPKILMYKEHFEVKAEVKGKGIVHYRISLYDMNNMVCSCVRLKIYCEDNSESLLTFKEEINFKEGTQLNKYNTYHTPEELFISYFGIHRTKKPKKNEKWKPNPALLQPAFLNDDDVFVQRVLNYDLFMTFIFNKEAALGFEIFAEPGPMDPNRQWPTTEKLITKAVRSKDEEITTPETMNDEEPTTTTPSGSADLTEQTTRESLSGMENWANNMLNNAEMSLMGDVEEEETESAARSERAPGAVMIVCCLVSACLSRAFFIHY